MIIFKVSKNRFFQYFPPSSRNILVNGEVVANVGEEVICDICNADCLFVEENRPPPSLYMVTYKEEPPFELVDVSMTICEKCAAEMLNTSSHAKMLEIV